MTHENDSQHDGKTFLDFLLALPLRANSTHNQLQALNLESHTRQAEHQRPTQAKRKHTMSRGNSKNEGGESLKQREEDQRISIDASMIDDYHSCFPCFASLLLRWFCLLAFIIDAIPLIDPLSLLLLLLSRKPTFLRVQQFCCKLQFACASKPLAFGLGSPREQTWENTN